VNDCVPGIVTPLAANNDVRTGGKEIDDLTFAFVSPLRSD